MSDEPKLWRIMTDAEKGALLLAKHEGKTIQWACTVDGGCGWGGWEDCDDDCLWDGYFSGEGFAYRVKPEPKVETVTEELHLWRNERGQAISIPGHDSDDPDALANITHTYTITDGRVTVQSVVHGQDD